MVKWRAKPGLGRNISSFITSLSIHRTDEITHHTPEPGTQAWYLLPSKYPNSHSAKPIMGSFNQFGPMKQAHRTISTCTQRTGKRSEVPEPATVEPVRLEASLFGKRCHFVKNAPGFPQFPFFLFFEQRQKVKQTNKKSLYLRTLKWKLGPCFEGLICMRSCEWSHS